jgi:hypothetical protein
MEDLFVLLVGQTPPITQTGPGHTYTLASIITILGGVVAILARAYVKARDERDQMAGETLEKVTEIVKQSIEAHTLQKTSNYQVAEALKGLDRRVEKLEEKVDAKK